jgi:hypothetical protein
MRGEVKLNYIEQPYQAVNNNYRNIPCIIAPFKDDSFVVKSYNTLDNAVEGEQTADPPVLVNETLDDNGATGYHYLQLLQKYFPGMQEIVLGNLTTNTGTLETPVYDYTQGNDQLSAIFTELDEVGVSFIVIPAELSITQYALYKAFYADQISKMNAFGLISPVTPTAETTTDCTGATIESTPNLTVIDTYFSAGGYWEKITTPIQINIEDNAFSLEETTIYLAGLTATLDENISLTHYVLDDVEGQITQETYSKAIFDLINNTGGLAQNYRDRIHGIVQIYNSGTSTLNENLSNTLDLKIERVHALIINEFRIALSNALGEDNNQVTYDNFESIARAIRDEYMIANYISDLSWEIDDLGTATISVPIQEQQYNILTTIDVTGVLIIE